MNHKRGVYRMKCEFIGGCWDGLWHDVLTDDDKNMPNTFDVLDDDGMGNVRIFQYHLKVYRDPEYGSTEYVYEMPESVEVGHYSFLYSDLERV
jgi:hypothetical protein